MDEWKTFVSGIYKAFPKKQANDLVRQLVQLDQAGRYADYDKLASQILIKVTQTEGAGPALLMKAAKAAPGVLAGVAGALVSGQTIRGVLKGFFGK